MRAKHSASTSPTNTMLNNYVYPQLLKDVTTFFSENIQQI